MSDDDVHRGAQQQHQAHHPYAVRIPGFLNDHDIGLGDVIKRATSSIGIRPCGGCEQRAIALNRLLVFSGRQER